jgi:hypothetical protein
MEQIIHELLHQLNSSVMVLLMILAVAFWAAFKIGGWSETFDHHKTRIGNVERISDVVVEIKTKVDLIYQYANPNSPVRATSPISLTESGKQIVSNLKADHIFQKYATQLVKEVDQQSPKNAYDIQKVSFEVCKKKFINFLNEEEVSAVKKEAFNRGLLAEDVLSVFGVLLRNHILDMRKIPIAEVDKHAPPAAS